MQVIRALGDHRKWPTLVFTWLIFKSYFKSDRIYFIISENNLIFFPAEWRDTFLYVKLADFGIKLS